MTDVYKDYFATINSKVKSLFEEMKSDYNFDKGDEFEIAVCKFLRQILPLQYGVCRGSVFAIDGKSIGDDIIIYDQQNFPTLRLLADNNYAQKQRIPVEAVVVYIEAKNTLILDENEGNSLTKAIKQATAIKNLGREEIPFNPMYEYGISNDKTKPGTIGFSTPQIFPQINNPFYTCIFSNGVRMGKGGKILTSAEIEKAIDEKSLSYGNEFVDLIIFNESILCYPIIDGSFASPFFLKNKNSNYKIAISENNAWGLGLSLMFDAFRKIHLGRIDWREILSGILGLRNVSSPEDKIGD